MEKVTIYTTRSCPFCYGAKQLFGSLDVDFEEVALDEQPDLRQELTDRHGWKTVPMIFIGDDFVGGFTDVIELHRDGELAKRLGAQQAAS